MIAEAEMLDVAALLVRLSELGPPSEVRSQSARIAAEALGFGPIAQSVPNPTHHFFGSGRVFHDFANGDQFWIGYSYEHRSSQNQGVGGTVLPSAATDTRFLEH